MSYGVEIFTNTGKLIYSTEMSTYNFVASYVIPAKGGVPISLPVMNLGFTDVKWFTSFLGSPPASGEAIIPTISFSGTTLSVGANSTVPVLIVVLAR